MTVNQAHDAVINALAGYENDDVDVDGLLDLRLGDLNTTEQAKAAEAIDALVALDRALAVRSDYDETDVAARKSSHDDE